MPATGIKSKWRSGDLEFYQSTADNTQGIRFGNYAAGDDFQLIFPDDGTTFTDSSTSVSGITDGTDGYLTVIVGTATRYIKLYDSVS